MAEANKSEKTEKSWQARISEATDAIGQAFVESISYDWRMYKQDIAGSIAHATMLAKVGLITDADRESIERGLRGIEAEIDRDGAKWAGFKPELEDLHMCVEAELTARIGEPGKKLHTGRSRNDQVALDLLMWCKSSAIALQGELSALQQAFVDAAQRNAGIIMPCYTHLQRAQPIDAGAELLAWATMFSRDWKRLDFLLGESGNLYGTYPLGSGAIAGSTLPLDRRVTQSLLAGGEVPTDEELNETPQEWFKRTLNTLEDDSDFPNELMKTIATELPDDNFADRWGVDSSNSIEATASRDNACDLLYGCAMISQHLSRWAEQWIIYMSSEFGFIKIADRYTTSSSMMPQKRNPDMLELIRGRCGNVYGDLFALMTILKGLPIGYNRDLQEDKRIVFRAYDTVSQCLTMAAAIVSSASFDKARIEPTLERGFLDATSLAEYLVTSGVPFRTAHHIVGTLVKQCENTGRHALSQLKLEEIKAVVEQSHPGSTVTQDVYNCLGAANVVKRYQSAGAAGGKPLEEQLKNWKKTLGMA